MTISTEKQLALKISITSFFVLLFILGSIIFSSYIYGIDRAHNDFLNEQHVFEGMPILGDI